MRPSHGGGVMVTMSIWRMEGLQQEPWAWRPFYLNLQWFVSCCRHYSLALLISSVYWATSDVFDPGLYQERSRGRLRLSGIVIEFNSSLRLHMPFCSALKWNPPLRVGSRPCTLCVMHFNTVMTPPRVRISVLRGSCCLGGRVALKAWVSSPRSWTV